MALSLSYEYSRVRHIWKITDSVRIIQDVNCSTHVISNAILNNFEAPISAALGVTLYLTAILEIECCKLHDEMLSIFLFQSLSSHLWAAPPVLACWPASPG